MAGNNYCFVYKGLTVHGKKWLFFLEIPTMS